MMCPVRSEATSGLLLDYCAHRLPQQISAELERHLGTCSECRQFVDGQRRLWAALDLWDPQPVSARFDQQLFTVACATDRRSFWPPVLGGVSGWRPVLSVAAACAALLLAVVLHFPGTGDADARVGPSSGSAVEKLEAEQVDRAAEDLDMLRQFSTPARDKRAL